MKYFKPLDSIDCGPACLRMIAYHHGKDYSLQYLRKISYLNKLGVSIYNLGKAAEEIGFKALVGELSFKYLTEKAILPCVLFWDLDHFVVLYKVKRKRFSGGKLDFYIADPGKGKLVLDEDAFKNYWLGEKTKGYALFLEPTPEFFIKDVHGEKEDSASSKRSAFKFLAHYFYRFKANYSQVFISMILAVFISLIFPFLTQGIIDFGVQRKDLSFIALVLFFQIFLFFTNTISDVIRTHLLMHISARINISILSDFLGKMMRLPMRFFDSKMAGDLVQRMQDHNRIEDFINTTLLTTLFSIINLVVFTVVLLYYNTSIFLIFIAGALLSIGWTLLFMRWRRSLDYRRFRELSNTNDKLFEMVNNMPEIKINGFEKYKQWEWQEVQVKLFKLDISSLSLEQYQRIGADFWDQLKIVLIMFVSAYSVIENQMSLGSMLAISYIVGQLNVPIKELIKFINTLQITVIGMERMNEVYVQDDEEKAGGKLQETLLSEKLVHGIQLKNVSFGYDGPNHDFVLKNINLEIEEGKVTAIVGSSGSGKTTLLKILLKFYSPLEGHIELNGTRLDSYSTDWWRQQCGTVMQEGHVFSDTIKRNVVMGDESNDNERLANAVETANISDFILDLPLHFDTKVGDSGIGMSTGQKQRLLIARAVYKNPNYLFFDEATSSLDATNEKIIMDNLDEFFSGKTVVIIAHRLSTVKNADKIVVIDKGQIVEVGDHKELVEKKGAYFTLIKNQLELGE